MSEHFPKNLLVIDKLSVGPVKIEKARIICPYTVTVKGKSDTQDLIYKYEEDVFYADNLGDLNLASIITSQVALNYGLFCKEIEFKGPYSETDKKFIKDMMENTSREIFVKKLLENNPFVLKEKIKPKPLKLKRYTQSKLFFTQKPGKKKTVPWLHWSTKMENHSVLSSGGKDSLLTYSLLKEIGKEAHPIYINESGRHWFTAMNAHNYFKKNVQFTSRVWTNSDHIFVWMLKHLSFIVKNFSNIRADEYPIRLWTVAVFIFGALPLLRKRKIGRLLIGDEYDTTQRRYYKNIPHHDGLFDQSRYFDNVMSRYFMRKGWNITQFSVLRSLSEMLIEKILSVRYPNYQKLQVSCHATHIKDRIAYPCGSCEKCRRIVGMLKAIGTDPQACGYTKEQISKCMKDIAKRGVHQESAGINQLYHLLLQKGLIDKSLLKFQPKESPEILSLRFDPDRSPVEAIPVDLRKPLYSIFLEHAHGALRREDKKWVKFDVLNDQTIDKPYPFEVDVKKNERTFQSKDYIYGDLSWPEIEKRFKEVDVAILPVGSLEQHGPHLPLDTDIFDAVYLAKRVAEACSTPRPLVLPGIAYGVSYLHDDFKGTVSVRNETLSNLVYDVGMSLARNGINKLFIINGHGGNSPALNYAAQMINRDAKIFVCVDTGETSDVDIGNIIETQNDVHAGEIETSTSLALRPELVNMRLAKKSVPKFSSKYLDFSSRRGVSWHAHTKRISSSGVMGDPTKASREKGIKIWEIMVAHLVNFIEDIKGRSLEDIHQRKY